MAEKKVKTIIRIFEDNTAEILEGKSLRNFLVQERAALALLSPHSWANPEKGKIKWLPVKKVKVTR